MPRIKFHADSDDELAGRQIRDWLFTVRDEEQGAEQHGHTVVVVLHRCGSSGSERGAWRRARTLFRGTCKEVLSSGSRYFSIADEEPLSGQVAAAWFDENGLEAVRSAIEINERFMSGLGNSCAALRVAVGVHEEDVLRTYALATTNQVAYSRGVLPATDLHTVPTDEELDIAIENVVERAKSCRLRYELPEKRLACNIEELSVVH